MLLKDYVWVFKTPLKQWIEFIKNRLTTSKYVLKGKCKMCGACCENILFSDEKGYIKEAREFEELRKRNRRYYSFEIAGTYEGEYTAEEFKDKRNIKGALLFRCKSLGEDKKCKNYFLRSLYCRDYPAINPEFIARGGTTLDGCGYYFDVSKKFKDFLK